MRASLLSLAQRTKHFGGTAFSIAYLVALDHRLNTMRRASAALTIVVVLTVNACGDATPTGTNNVATVELTAPSNTLRAGTTLTLAAKLKDPSGNALDNIAIIWSSSNSSVATVSNSGVVSATLPGAVTIAASASGKSATTHLTVTDRDIATVVVSPPAASVRIGTTITLGAQTLDAEGKSLSNRVVSWTTNNSAIATINNTGVVTGVAPGVATITATSEGHTGTAAVTVTVNPVATVSVSPALVTLGVGTDAPLSVTLRDAGGAALTNRVITWSSSNLTVATVSSNGVVTALTPGNTIVSAASEGHVGTASVSVLARLASSVTLTPSSTSITTGSSVQLISQITDPAGNLLIGRPISFTSDNNAVATVNATGLVTAIAPGSARITATSEGKVGTANIIVTPLPVGSVLVGPPTANVFAGATTQLTAQPLSAGGAVLFGRTVTWTSGAPTVASVSANGLVTGIAPGVALILAIVDGVAGSSTVTVAAQTIASISVVASPASIAVDGTSQVTATPRDNSGNPLANRIIVWKSSDENIAFVTSTGLVIGLKIGSAIITATSEGVSGAAIVTVH